MRAAAIHTHLFVCVTYRIVCITERLVFITDRLIYITFCFPFVIRLLKFFRNTEEKYVRK